MFFIITALMAEILKRTKMLERYRDLKTMVWGNCSVSEEENHELFDSQV